MTVLQAIALALVQGLTEFLPISSSAHLILLPHLFGWEDQGLVFDAAANSGTLLAVVLYFRQDLRSFLGALIDRLRKPGKEGVSAQESLLWKVSAATLPVAAAGWLIKDWVATQARNPALIAATSIAFGVLLGVADRIGRRELPMLSVSWPHAAAIGIAQTLALVPGVSRAGITMTAGLLAGLSRDAAARFSFLLYIPVSLLVAANDLRELLGGRVLGEDLLPLGIVFLGSAIVGYGVIELLLAWLRRQGLMPFVIYRIGLGVVLFALLGGEYAG